jgi:hypothetical protein
MVKQTFIEVSFHVELEIATWRPREIYNYDIMISVGNVKYHIAIDHKRTYKFYLMLFVLEIKLWRRSEILRLDFSSVYL